MTPDGSNGPMVFFSVLFWIGGLIIGITLFAAAMKLFSISKSLQTIVAELAEWKKERAEAKKQTEGLQIRQS